jgi:hypothetical protein
LRDVTEDAITALILDPSDPDIARGPGLRAGRYRVDSENTLVLDGVAFVPGVTLSGRLEHFLTRRQHGRLRIGGRAAPHGLLNVRRQRVAGRLGGRRVSGSLTAPTAVVALRAQRQSRSLAP